MDAASDSNVQAVVLEARQQLRLEPLNAVRAGQRVMVERAVGTCVGWRIGDVEHAHAWAWMEHFDHATWVANATDAAACWRLGPAAGDGRPDLLAVGQAGVSGQSVPIRGGGRRLTIDAGEWRLRPPRLRVGGWRLDDHDGRRAAVITFHSAPLDSAILKRLEINLLADLETSQPALLVLLITYTLLIERHSEAPTVWPLSS